MAALVVGLDLVPSKPNPPENYRFVRASVLQSTPFVGGTFVQREWVENHSAFPFAVAFGRKPR